MNSQNDRVKEELIPKAFFIFPVSACARLKTAQEIFVFFLAASIIALFISLPFTVAEAGTMGLDFGKDGLSANIKKSSLKTVVEKIAEKKGIWIKGAENLSEEIYSVEFEGVSIREALERMLSPFNCCYFIDQKGVVLGVIIVSKKSRRSLPRSRSVAGRVYRGSRRR